MKIHIIHKEDVAWILKKIVNKLQEELILLNCEVTVSKEPREDVDVNYYVYHEIYRGERVGKLTSIMIAHLGTNSKDRFIKKYMSMADVGIAFSKDTQQYLFRLGINHKKLFYVNPAHDSIIQPRKRIIGLTTNVYSDGRKNEDYLLEVIPHLSNKNFKIIIIGIRWEAILVKLREAGFEVENEEFEYSYYHSKIHTFDYYFYFGFDEGSMGVLDAIQTGAHVVTTPQGFHLDFKSANLTFVNSKNEFIEFLKQLNRKYTLSLENISHWTWKNYAIKHLEIWNYKLGLPNQNLVSFEDGLNSRIKFQNYFYTTKLYLFNLSFRAFNALPLFIKNAYWKLRK